MTLLPGYYPQIYLDAIHGNKPQAIATALYAFKSVGITGVLWHMFPNGTPEKKFRELSSVAQSFGIKSGVAFGLDSKKVSARDKGMFVSSVASLPECFCTALNCEGYWDSGKAGEAVEMCEVIKEQAPGALLVDQPWPVPSVHSRFPWVEFSRYVSGHFYQAYFNNWKAQHGTERFEFCDLWFEKEWKKLENTKLKDMKIPRGVTLQAYAWDDVLDDLVTCLLKYPTAILWSDPFPTESTTRGLRVVKRLSDLGLASPDAVSLYQQQMGLDVDGRCGPETLRSLGL